MKKYSAFILIVCIIFVSIPAIPLFATTPTGLINGEDYYIMNSATGKYLSPVSSTNSNNVRVVGRDRGTQVFSRWTVNMLESTETNSQINYTRLTNANGNAGRNLYVSGTNLVIYDIIDEQSSFIVQRIESGNHQGQYTIRYGNQYIAMDSSRNVYLTTSSSANIYWTFMAVNTRYADMYGSYITSPQNYAIDTTVHLQKFVDVLDDMGYLADGWTNYSAEAAYDLMPYDDVCIIIGHADAGIIDFCNGIYERNNISSIAAHFDVKFKYGGNNYKFISNYIVNQLAQVRCVIYIGCNSGDDYVSNSGNTYNLVDTTFEKGAHYVLGLTESVQEESANRWLGYFIDGISESACGELNSIKEAIEYANDCCGEDSIMICVNNKGTETTADDIYDYLSVMPIHFAGDAEQILDIN